MLWFVIVLWLIQIANALFGLELFHYGVLPGELYGLRGVLFAPLIHISFTHIFSNTLPILVLGTAMLLGYPRSSKWVFLAIYFGVGILVWLFARTNFHVGASGISFGFLAFVFVIGILRWDKRAIALSCLVFFMYGSMIWGIFPTEPDVSFESHFFGAVIGVLCAILFRNVDAKPPEKRYEWEYETEELEEYAEDKWVECHCFSSNINYRCLSLLMQLTCKSAWWNT
ncbi:MAG: rhomboid family intramembrane serine protease [Gammaproteobacteria bacterium]|nr:rhomboid family intramembrane serine protease [Gammaproteobacteria bacterium]MDH5801608.1 rhomboid family intramembrane serine protease [Gammaproteobacteria bacterium]